MVSEHVQGVKLQDREMVRMDDGLVSMVGFHEAHMVQVDDQYISQSVMLQFLDQVNSQALFRL